MMEKFTKLEMEILEKRFIERMSTAEIYLKLHISTSKILDLETRAIKKVFNILKEYDSRNN